MVGVLLIATRKYKLFVEPLLMQIDKFFLQKEELVVFIFTDGEFSFNQGGRLTLVQLKIPPYGFPEATLYRYHIFHENRGLFEKCSHVFYSDIDMAIVDTVGEEILGDGLTVVRHPGFYNGGWGAKEVNPASRAFIPEEGRLKYFAGGFNGGKTEVFLQMCKILSENIAEDESRGIVAQHNDEAHLNHYIYAHPDIHRIELHSGFCMVESEYLRANWGISHLPVFIIALDKNHAEIRS